MTFRYYVACILVNFAFGFPAIADQLQSVNSPLQGLSAVEVRQIDEAIGKIIDGGVPGISLAIARDGTVVYTNGYGVMDLKSRRPVTPTTRMEIGSVTKQFTAAAILQLVEAGKLSLDDPLGKFVPEYAAGRAITIRQLLWQVSGLPDYLPNNVMIETRSARQRPTVGHIVGLMSQRKPEFAAGTRWAYSNTNYFLLGLVIERVSQTDYDAYIKENILDRAGMTRTTTIAHETSLDDFPTGYWLIKGQRRVAPQLENLWPWSAGDLVSDVQDLTKWDAALFAGKIISDADVALMMTPGMLNDGTPTKYGMGWIVDNTDGHKLLWHTGGTLGFSAVNAVYPDDHLRLIAILNSTEGEPETVTQEVFDILYPDAVARRYQPAEGEEPAITAKLKNVIEELQAGELNRTELASKFQARMTPAWLARSRAVLAPLGEIQLLVFKGKNGDGDAAKYNYLARFKDDHLRFTLGLDRGGKITALAAD